MESEVGLDVTGRNNSDQLLVPSIVPSRKGSMVLIDQIPEIISTSGERYRRQSMADSESPELGHPVSSKPRYSIFSTYSRRGSAQSDVSFWDPHESLPDLDHYKHSHSITALEGFRPRPTLQDLRDKMEPAIKSARLGDDLDDLVDAEKDQTQTDKPQPQKMGWILGVLVRCLLNIFGVMLFLRLTWVTGQAGIGLGTVIVLLASLVTTLTTMSMAAICTNGEVRGGGVYYMISRSLGPEFGGSIGIIFSLANAVAAAMYVVGFAESVRDLVKDTGGAITGDSINDVRAIGCATNCVILMIVLIGLQFETKAQLILLVILVVSLVNYFVGTFLPPSESQRREGFVGYQEDVFLKNFGPDFRTLGGVDYDFFTVFAIYFPAATGILAGANISGDLKNPSSAIPRGTFLAIFLTTAVYLAVVWTSGGSMLKDAIGNNGTALANITLSIEDIGNCANATCQYGLQNSRQIMGIACAFEPLIYAGIFSATLSSALASMVSAPKVFQALGKDKLFPYVDFFGKPYGKTGEPRRGYLLTFVICMGVTAIGSLDTIAPIISNFFLMAYALVNFSCFDAAFANTPGFRPSYHWFNKWLSLIGAVLCIVIMFMMSWWAALVTVLVIGALYAYLVYKKPDVNWGSSGQAHLYKFALRFAHRLMEVDEHIKNFRPQILVMTGYPRNRPALVDFAACITKRQGLLICAHIFEGDMQQHLRHLGSTAAYRWFRNRGVHAFYNNIAAPSFRLGAQILLQSQGLGKLKPNMLLLGYKSNWYIDNPRTVYNYVSIINDAFDLHYGVGILRVPGGFDTNKVSDALLDTTDETLDVIDFDLNSSDEDDESKMEEGKRRPSKTFSGVKEEKNVQLKKFEYKVNNAHLNPGYTSDNNDLDGNSHPAGDKNEDEDKEMKDEENVNNEMKDGQFENKQHQTAEQMKYNSTMTDTPNHSDKTEGKVFSDKVVATGVNDCNTKIPFHSVLSKTDSLDDPNTVGRFRTKQTGTIDVWWLFDDGGLGLLVPYILSRREPWRKCKLRVFCTGTKHSNLDDDHRRMAAMLSKFRIEFSDITIIPDLHKKPHLSSFKEFEKQIYPWRLNSNESQEDYPWKISDTDLTLHKDKTYMQIKIREKVLEYSMKASLIVITLPVPRKYCPAGLYMAWLDTLTRDLPPTLLLRGNQQSVLTYFS